MHHNVKKKNILLNCQMGTAHAPFDFASEFSDRTETGQLQQTFFAVNSTGECLGLPVYSGIILK